MRGDTHDDADPGGWLPQVPAPPQPWAPPAPPRRRRWTALLALPLVAALVAAGLVVVGASDPDDDLAWDPRLAPLVAFVEDARGLEFDHVVPIEFLTEQEWAELMEVDESSFTHDERAENEAWVEALRSFGLVEGDFDLYEESSELAADYYVALFDPARDRIEVRGEDRDTFDVSTRVTIVHELTHALQHQHFDLIALQDSADDASALAITGLIEGDATLVQWDFVASLSPSEQDEYFSSFESIEDPGADAPAGLAVTASVPYALGPALAMALDERGELDDAFFDAPSNEEHLLDPTSFISREQPQDVPEPEIPKGAERVELMTQFGAIGLFTMLAERIRPHEALAAADAWDGDAPVSYRIKGRLCTRVNFAAANPDALGRIDTALRRWAASLPEKFASVSLEVRYVRLETCDPGPGVDLLTGKAYEAIQLAAFRSTTSAELLEFGYEPDDARCIANRLVADLTLDEVLEFDPEDERWSSAEYQAQLMRVIDRCLAQ